MTIYFKNGDTITDKELEDIVADPCAEDVCIRCGSFSNWGENMLCLECQELYDYEDL